MSDKIFDAAQSASANETAINAAFESIGQGGGGSANFPNSLVIMGDSIATPDNGQWYDSLINKFGITTINNIAVSNAKWHHSENSKRLLNPPSNSGIDNIITNQVFTLIDRCSKQPSQTGYIPAPDVIFIHCGINDYSNESGDVDDVFDFVNVPTDDYLSSWSESDGTWTCDNSPEDYPSMLTIAGGMRFALSLLRKNFPYSKIVLTTPLYTAPSQNAKVREINETIKKAASYMSIPVLDLTYVSGIFSDNLGLYLRDDGLHPNHRGGKLLADVIGNFLMSQFGKKIYDYRSYTISGTFLIDGEIPDWEQEVQLHCGNTYAAISIACESDGTFEADVPASVYSFKKRPFLTLVTVNGEDTINVSENLTNLVVTIPYRTVGGTIKDKDGNALANTQITVYAFTGSNADTLISDPVFTFTTGSGGSFSIEKLPVGNYRFVYSDNGTYYRNQNPIGVGAGSSSSETKTITLDKPIS